MTLAAPLRVRRFRTRSQKGQQLSSRVLLRGFLGRALGAAHEFRVLPIFRMHTGFDRKCLAVLRSGLFDEHVRGLRQAETLHRFLQGGFKIRHGQRAAAALHPLQFRSNHVAQNELLAPPQVRHPDRSPPESLPVRPPAMPSCRALRSFPRPAPAAGSGRVPVAVPPWIKCRSLTRCARNFESSPSRKCGKRWNNSSLVTSASTASPRNSNCSLSLTLYLALPGLLGFLFARLRTVRDRLFYDGAAPEMVAQSLFQRRDFPFFHIWGQRPFDLLRAGSRQSGEHARRFRSRLVLWSRIRSGAAT